jgi:hypothetical protein
VNPDQCRPQLVGFAGVDVGLNLELVNGLVGVDFFFAVPCAEAWGEKKARGTAADVSSRKRRRFMNIAITSSSLYANKVYI